MWELETYWKILLHWLWLLILGAVAGAGVTYLLLNFLGLMPQYEAVATLTIGAQLEAATISEEELSIGQDLVPNYVVLAKRPPITEAVIRKLNLDISTSTLVSRKLEVSQQGQTRVVLITGTDSDPVVAAAIANETAQQMRASGPLRPIELIQIVALAKAPTDPSNEPILIIVLGGLAGAILAAVLALLIELKRDRPRTVGWAASRIDLPIIGSFKGRREIPVISHLFSGRKRPSIWKPPDPVWWAVMETYKRMLNQRPLADSTRQRRVLVVLSSDPTRSTAFSALELSRAWATTGESVVLVDADLKILPTDCYQTETIFESS